MIASVEENGLGHVRVKSETPRDVLKCNLIRFKLVQDQAEGVFPVPQLLHGLVRHVVGVVNVLAKSVQTLPK